MERPFVYNCASVWPSRWTNSKKQIQDWRVRLTHEINSCSSNYFCTLTLNDQALLEMCYEPDVYMLQKFLKRVRIQVQRRLRSQLSNKNLKIQMKYFLVSEFGSQTHRLHYHAIFMFKEYVPFKLFNQIIQENWYYGFVKNEVLKSSSGARYVCKYILKKFFEKHIKLQSQGIGLSYLTRNLSWIRETLASGQLPKVSASGRLYRLPRYYKKKAIDVDDELKAEYSDICAAITSKSEPMDSQTYLIQMSKKQFFQLEKVNHTLYQDNPFMKYIGLADFEKNGLLLPGDNPQVYVECGLVLSNLLFKYQRQEDVIDAHKRGVLSFDDVIRLI